MFNVTSPSEVFSKPLHDELESSFGGVDSFSFDPDELFDHRVPVSTKDSPPSLSFDSLPPELWFRIFSSPLLSARDRKELSRSCRLLRSMIQPTLFTTIRIAWRLNLDEGQLNANHQGLLQLLEFLTSTRIAGHVNAIGVYTHSALFKARSRKSYPSYNELVIDPLFHALPSLPNLRVLAADFLELTRSRLSQLSQIPSLTSLHLCRVVNGPDLVLDEAIVGALKLRVLSIADFATTSYEKPLVPWWMALLLAGRVEDFRLTDQDHMVAARPIIISGPSLPAIRVLEIREVSASFSDLPEFLSKFPSLETFRVFPKQRSPDFLVPPKPLKLLPKHILPTLKNLGGPIHIVIPYLQDREICSLDISDHWGEIDSDTVQTIQKHCPHLASLTVRSASKCELDDLAPTVLSILRSLTHLGSLIVRSELRNMELREVCESLQKARLPLSDFLESFIIVGSENTQSDGDIDLTPNNVALLRQFQHTFPNLRRFFVSSRSGFISWPGPIPFHSKDYAAQVEWYERERY